MNNALIKRINGLSTFQCTSNQKKLKELMLELPELSIIAFNIFDFIVDNNLWGDALTNHFKSKPIVSLGMFFYEAKNITSVPEFVSTQINTANDEIKSCLQTIDETNSMKSKQFWESMIVDKKEYINKLTEALNKHLVEPK